MKRSFLEELKLDKETIDKILDEHGKDLENTKTELTAQRDDYKNQLDKAQNTLKSFEGVDVNELQGKIKKLEEDITAEKTKGEQRVADIQFTHKLENKAAEMGARNVTAVMSLIDVDTLKESKNQDEDIEAAFTAVKEKNDYLFGSNEPINNPTGVGGTEPGGDGGDDGYLKAMRAAMGLSVDEK